MIESQKLVAIPQPRTSRHVAESIAELSELSKESAIRYVAWTAITSDGTAHRSVSAEEGLDAVASIGAVALLMDFAISIVKVTATVEDE